MVQRDQQGLLKVKCHGPAVVSCPFVMGCPIFTLPECLADGPNALL